MVATPKPLLDFPNIMIKLQMRINVELHHDVIDDPQWLEKEMNAMKRLLSLFFAVILLFSVVPLNAFAAEELTVETETADPFDLPVEEESEVPVLLASGDVTLTGTIQLPDGGTAPSKTYFIVSYETEDVSDYFHGYFEAGAASANWSITLPADSVVKYLIIHISEPHLLGALGELPLPLGRICGGRKRLPVHDRLRACRIRSRSDPDPRHSRADRRFSARWI